MKLHPAATLALFAWYLIIPPIEGDLSTLHANAAAPLSKWDIVDQYDSQPKCDLWRAIWNREDTWFDITEKLNSHPPKRDAFAKSICVPTDDPRIQGNSDIRHFKSGHWETIDGVQ